VTGNEIALKVKIADMRDDMNIDLIANPTEKDWQRLQKYQAILLRLLEIAKTMSRTRFNTNVLFQTAIVKISELI
jgi:hypothetical protein